MATTTTTTAAEIAQERLLTWVHSLVFDELAPSEEPTVGCVALHVLLKSQGVLAGELLPTKLAALLLLCMELMLCLRPA